MLFVTFAVPLIGRSEEPFVLRSTRSFKPGTVCFAPTRDRFAIACFETSSVRVFEPTSDQAILTISNFRRESEVEDRGGQTSFGPLRFSPDGNQLAVSLAGPIIKKFDSTTGKEIEHFQPVSQDYYSISVSPDLQCVAIGGKRDITIWRMSTSSQIKHLAANHFYVWSLAYAPSGKLLASASPWPRNGVKLWSSSNGKEILELEGMGTFEHTYEEDGRRKTVTLPLNTSAWSPVCFSQDGTRVIASGQRIARFNDGRVARLGAVSIWSTEDGKRLWTLEEERRRFGAVAMHPSGKWLFVANAAAQTSERNDSTFDVLVIDVTSRRVSALLRGHHDIVTSMTVSHSGRLAATTSSDGVLLWDLSNVAADER